MSGNLKFLDENDIDPDNKNYLELKNILSSNLGYLGKFTEWLFQSDNSLSFLEDIYKMIKNTSLDKDINSFKTAEDLYDYLTEKKFNTKVSQVIKSLPSRARRLANQDLKDLIKNNIDTSDSIKDFYSKKGGQYNNITDLIKDTKFLILNLQGEWNPESIKYQDKELIYKDSNTLILHIDSYDRSCDLGSKHWCISTSENMFEGHTEVVKLLLQDKRVDPSVGNNSVIRLASQNGHTDVVKLLLQDGRVDPSNNDNCAIIWASENGHINVVKLLSQDERVDPSDYNNKAIRISSANGHTDVVKLLLQDKRVDPTADDNYAIEWASENGHTDTVELLLQDERVREKLDPPENN